MQLRIKKTHADAKLPTYAHLLDAGMDLYSLEETTMRPGDIVKVRTGVAFELPPGTVGLIWDKSSIGINEGIKTLGGVVDAGYRGEVFVGFVNISKKSYTFHKHQKIAQMLVQSFERPILFEVETLSETDRDQGGFGSTGK
jgi:dUTP pyrophosphatase